MESQIFSQEYNAGRWIRSKVEGRKVRVSGTGEGHRMALLKD
jgi:hypothetical protein